MSTTTEGAKKVWRAQPWPRDAKAVPGVHPALRAHSSRGGFLVQLDWDGKEMLSRIKGELEEKGETHATRNLFLRSPDGTEAWWTSVDRVLLSRLSELSYPEPITPPEPDEIIYEAKPPAGDPKSHEKKIAAVDRIETALAELESVISSQIESVTDGHYIPFSKTRPELLTMLKAQRLGFRTLRGRFSETLDACRDEV